MELWQVSWFPTALLIRALCIQTREIFSGSLLDCMQTSSKLPTSSTDLYSVNSFTAAAAPRSPPCSLRNVAHSALTLHKT